MEIIISALSRIVQKYQKEHKVIQKKKVVFEYVKIIILNRFIAIYAFICMFKIYM